MRIPESTLENFLSVVRTQKKKIVVYGAGVIGKVTLPAWIEERQLEEEVLFVTDADSRKWGGSLQMGNRQCGICSPERLKETKEKFVILITASRYSTILQYLDRMEELAETDVYIFPLMLTRECRAFEKQTTQKSSEAPVIPKTIHYCWFGRGKLSEEMERCRENWRKFCPDYQIIQWNEDNYDLEKYLYTRQAYHHKKWGFIPDVARLEILYENGGIYLDTDVELIRSLDELLYQPGFVGVEKWGVINVGGGCGVMPHHPMIRKLLEYRLKFPFEWEDGSLNLESSGSYESKPFLDCGFKPDNTIQNVGGMTVYTSDFFHPFDYVSRELCVTENTYGIHHFTASWV